MDIFIKDEYISEKNGQQFSSSTMNPCIDFAEGIQICSSANRAVSMLDSFSPWDDSTMQNWNHNGIESSILSHIPADSDFNIIEDVADIVEFRNRNPSNELKEKGSSSSPIGSNNESMKPERIEVCQDVTNLVWEAEGSSLKALSAKKRKADEGVTLVESQVGNKEDVIDGKKEQKQVKNSTKEAKGDYVHIRARRGQATNSHSLAERIRRERISERMKFLQDLVPGCSKVSGKAVMLDEIINYVQSLQRQVEFLSMKLASVNPRIDFDVEALLSRHLHSHGGDFIQSGLSNSTVHRQMYSSQQGLFQVGLPSTIGSSRTIQRELITQVDPMNKTNLQGVNAWHESHQNALEMPFNDNPEFRTLGYNNHPRQNLQT